MAVARGEDSENETFDPILVKNGCAVESDSRNGRTAPVAVTTLGTPEGASRAGFGVR